MFQSKRDAGFCVMSFEVWLLEEFSALHEEMLDDRPQSQRG